MLITATPTLTTCEQLITAGLKAFRDMGEALKAIRDGRLYQPAYPSFEAYCSRRWELSRPRAYQLMDASTVVSNLSTNGDAIPANERQARELVTLDPEAQRVVWSVVQQTAPGGIVTAAHVKSVVTVFRECLITGAIPDGDGSQVRVHDLVTAAITEETYERLQRQTAYILDQTKSRPMPDRLSRLTTAVSNLQAIEIPIDQRYQVAGAARQLAGLLTTWAAELERAA